jgi:hypothetical protein
MQYPSRGLCLESSAQAVGVHEVREGLLPVDLDDRDPLPVGTLELGIAGDVDLDELEPDVGADGLDHPRRALAEMAALRPVEGHPAPGGRHRVMVKTASAVDGWTPSSPSTGCARRRMTYEPSARRRPLGERPVRPNA